MKELKTYEDFMDALEECHSEADHDVADEILMQLAIHTYMSKEQRIKIVEKYDSVPKWFD
jgi:hypothetical protein